MPFEIFTKKENPSEAELEMEEIYELDDRRELLQQRWSELFEEEEDMEMKYPFEARYSSDKKFKSDRSFLSEQDMEKFKDAEEGMVSIRKETAELDKEILKMRFKYGVKHLTELLNRDSVEWKVVRDYKSDPNVYTALRSKKWVTKIGDDIAEVEFSGEKTASFTRGVKEVADEIGDMELLQSLEKLPKERSMPYVGYHMRFLYGPIKRKKQDEYLRPGLALWKRYDSYNDKYDITEAELPLSLGTYDFPQINEEENERARKALIRLAKELDIENI
ncbi:MAG: hypothetical protein V1845_02570 [bacterium]